MSPLAKSLQSVYHSSLENKTTLADAWDAVANSVIEEINTDAFNSLNLVQAIYQWNATRYGTPDTQNFTGLSQRLLSEETAETNEALEICICNPEITAIAHAAKELSDVLYVVFGRFYHLGLTPEQAIKSVWAVIESNESKPIKKMSSTEKTNKGDNYIPAEPMILEILNG